MLLNSSMKTRIAIVGGGGHARMIADLLNQTPEYDLAGYTDLSSKGSICGSPYLGVDEVLPSLGIQNAVIGVSYLKSPRDTSLRLKIISDLLGAGIRFPVVKSVNSTVSLYANISQGTVIGNGAIINPGVEIGPFAVINTGAIIDHDVHVGEHSTISPGAVVCGGVRIGSNCFVSAGVTIRDAVSVCDNVLIGAGSVVVKNIELAGVYFGNPARLIDSTI